ncbi:hypothetical protein ACWEKT_03125 [Nocardia takedensis]
MAGLRLGGPAVLFPPDPGSEPVEPGGIPEWATPDSGYPGVYQEPSAPQVELLVGETVVAVGTPVGEDSATLTVAAPMAIAAGDILTIRVADSAPVESEGVQD